MQAWDQGPDGAQATPLVKTAAAGPSDGAGQERPDPEGGAAAEVLELAEGFDEMTLAEEDGEAEALPQQAEAPGQKPAGQQQVKPQRARQRGQARPRLTVAEVEAENRRLAAHQGWLQGSSEHASLRSQRQALPAVSKREELLQLMRAHPVLVISGATGCGKSTQVRTSVTHAQLCAGAAICLCGETCGALEALAI